MTEQLNQTELYIRCLLSLHIPGGVSGKEPTNAGDIKDAGFIPGSGQSPGEGHDNPLQYSCLENLMDREAR